MCKSYCRARARSASSAGFATAVELGPGRNPASGRIRREHFRLFRRSPARAGRAKMYSVSEEASGAVIRVVYVEDDERLARLTTHYLNSHGIEVHRVSRGDQALGE